MKVTATTRGTLIRVSVSHGIELSMNEDRIVKCYRRGVYSCVSKTMELERLGNKARNGLHINNEYWAWRDFAIHSETENHIASFIKENESIIEDLEHLIRTTEDIVNKANIEDEVKHKRALSITNLINALQGE